MCIFIHIYMFLFVFFLICPRRGNCKKASLGLVCEIGLRCRTYYVLCGSVLSVWTKVEGVLASVSGTNVKMQIVRLRTEDGQRIVGESFFFLLIRAVRIKKIRSLFFLICFITS